MRVRLIGVSKGVYVSVIACLYISAVMNYDELPIIPVCTPHLAPRRGSCPDLLRVLCGPALNVRVLQVGVTSQMRV